MNRDETLNRRLTLLSMGLIGVSLILLARLLSFQFRMNPEIKQALENQARNRYQQTIEVLPARGQIFDRDGYLLATNSFEYRIGISPNQVIDRQDVAMKLAPLVGLSEDKLYRLLEPDANGQFPPYVLLASRVSAEVGQAIADLDIDGIIIEPLPIRIYPQGSLMAQIVGIFAGADEQHTGQGYYGVEGYYQTLLAGQSKRVTKSTIPLLEESQTKATRVRDGMSLILTIDRDLQFLAQEVLTGFLEKDEV